MNECYIPNIISPQVMIQIPLLFSLKHTQIEAAVLKSTSAYICPYICVLPNVTPTQCQNNKKFYTHIFPGKYMNYEVISNPRIHINALFHKTAFISCKHILKMPFTKAGLIR